MNIIEIEAYWQSVDFSKPQPEINIGCERINDLGVFTKSHIAILKYNAGVRLLLPYIVTGKQIGRASCRERV